MNILRTKGLVIKETNVGEADKIITIFTAQRGKIQASARGARKYRSSIIAGTQFLCYSDFVLYKGKTLYSVSQCEVIDSFFNTRNGIEKLSYATYFVELASAVIEEDYPNYKLLRLILNTLHMLSYTQKDPRIIKIVYEFRLMSIIGFAPNLVGCTNCGEASDKIFFNSSIGGLICSDCLENTKSKGTIALSDGAIQAMRHILYSAPNRIFSFKVSEKVQNELDYIAHDFILTHIGKEFKTLKFLKDILSLNATKNILHDK